MEKEDDKKVGAETTSQIIHQAAQILEEELARGVTAAKEVDERFLNLEQIRTTDPSELSTKLRDHVHDIADILIDLASVTIGSAVTITDKTVFSRIPFGGSQEKMTGAHGIPTLMNPEPVKPGAKVSIPFIVENSKSESIEKVHINAPDLMNSRGKVIAARNINFKPAEVSVSTYDMEKVYVVIQIPKDAEEGIYSGIIRVNEFENFQMNLSVHVG